MKDKSKAKKKRPRGYAAQDFTEESLPHNRFEVFFDLLKTRWRLFLLIGAIFFLFFLPLLGSLAAESLFSSSLYASFLSGETTESAYRANLFSLRCAFLAIDFFLFLLLSLPFSGFARVYRLLVHYEMLDFKSDFFKGVKDNFLHTFFLFLLASVLFCLSSLLATYFMASGSKGFWQTVAFFAPIFIFLLVFFPSFALSYCQIPFYSSPFSLTLKNGFKLYASFLFQSLLFAALLIAPCFLLLLGNFYVLLISFGLFPLIYLPLSLLCLFLSSVSIFDKAINKNEYPELVDKGIHRIEK